MKQVIDEIRDVTDRVKSEGVHVILFGSQARGEARDDSDWDLLVLFDKDTFTDSDYERYVYPFWELGWRLNVMIHPLAYTRKEWQRRRASVFRKNVEKEGIVLC